MPTTSADNGLYAPLPAEPLRPDAARRSHPLNRGRVAWWLALPGKSGGPTWLDVLGLYPGYLSTSGGAGAQVPTWVASSRPGGPGALALAAGQYVNCGPGPAFALSRSFAIAAWVRPAAIGSIMAIISRGQAGFYLRLDAAGRMEWLAAGVAVVANGATPLAAGAWSHVAAVVDGSGNARLFLNGRLDGTAASAQAYTGELLLLGVETPGNPSSNLIGQMDDVSVWARALSDGDVGQLYRESALGYPGALRGTREGFMAAAAAGVAPGAIGVGSITVAGGGTASPSVVAAGAVGVGSITVAGGGTTGAGAIGTGTITLAGGGTASGGGANIFTTLASYRRRRNG